MDKLPEYSPGALHDFMRTVTNSCRDSKALAVSPISCSIIIPMYSVLRVRYSEGTIQSTLRTIPRASAVPTSATSQHHYAKDAHV